MKLLRQYLAATLLTVLSLTVVTAKAFFDEAAVLRAELVSYQEQHTTDMSAIVARLDALTGTVFQDVKSDDWFNVYVSSLAEWGIVSGYKNAAGELTGFFQPGNLVTVAEVLKMTEEAAKIDKSTCPAPAAHPAALTHWSSVFVGCAEGLNVRLLAASSNLPLDRPATRAEVLTIVHDVFGQKPSPVFAPFSDTRDHPLEADIGLAVLEGIVGGDKNADGTPAGTFRPDAPINRAEVSKIVYERLKMEAKKEFDRNKTEE